MEHRIFVSVQGGVAEVCEETVPAGIVVEILDFDNFAANPERELSLWSPELRAYWTKSLAIPAAVAIQNARLYEQAEIFRAELEQRLADLEHAEKALREMQHGREVS